MIKSVNAKILEEILKQALRLARVTAKERSKIMRFLKKLSYKLAGKLVSSGYSQELSSRKRRACIEKIIKEATMDISRELAGYRRGFQNTLADIAVFSSIDTVHTIDVVVPINIVLKGGLSKAQSKVLASESWISGKTVNEMFSGLEAQFANKFKEFVRKGYTEGKTVQQMTRELTGYKDKKGVIHKGLADMSRHSAESLVRTSVMGVSNAARMETYRDNDSIVKGVQWVSTLDLRTCIDCGMRDGAAWDLEGNPTSAHNFVYEEPPLHANCRCVLVPVVKSFEELGLDDLDEFPGSTRASMDGQVSDTVTFQEWFEDLPPEEQTEILGKGRYELYRDGKITFSDLVDQNGRGMSLKDLYESFEL